MMIIKMKVHMDCAGCQTKIKKALQKLDGVNDVEIDFPMQKVSVTGLADAKKVLEAVRNTGRIAQLWPYPYNPEFHSYNQRYSYQQWPSDPSTYNYKQQGYTGDDYGNYQSSLYNHLMGDRTCAMC